MHCLQKSLLSARVHITSPCRCLRVPTSTTTRSSARTCVRRHESSLRVMVYVASVRVLCVVLTRSEPALNGVGSAHSCACVQASNMATFLNLVTSYLGAGKIGSDARLCADSLTIVHLCGSSQAFWRCRLRSKRAASWRASSRRW